MSSSNGNDVLTIRKDIDLRNMRIYDIKDDKKELIKVLKIKLIF